MSSETTGATGLAGRYATALFDLAKEQGALDAVAADLDALGGMVADSADLRRLVRSPVITRADQGAAMAALLERGRACEIACQFIGVLAANRRLFALPAIIEEFQAFMSIHKGEVTAKVTTARPLGDDERAELERALKPSTGGSVTLKTEVDPSLIGGMVVRLGSNMVDSSLKTKLQNMRLAMRGVG